MGVYYSKVHTIFSCAGISEKRQQLRIFLEFIHYTDRNCEVALSACFSVNFICRYAYLKSIFDVHKRFYVYVTCEICFIVGNVGYI